LAEAGMRGPAGSALTLALRRGGAPLTLRFPRGEVVVPTVSGAARGPAGPDLWLSAEDGLGYVKISAFKPTSLAAFDALALPAAPQLRGLVLDLRGNGGGDVNAAVQIADRFIAEGPLVQAVGQRPPPAGPLTDPATGAPLTPWDQAVAGDALEGLPLVVLVDADSASAAEVLAGALQQRAGAVVVGGPTFGKGAAQRLYTDPDARFALQYTNLLWALPDGRRLHRAGAGGGLLPDLRLVQGPAAQACADAAARRRAEPVAHPDGAPFRSGVEPCADPALVDAPLLAAELIVLAQQIARAAAR
jgi:carboxyl-terminal processing protease